MREFLMMRKCCSPDEAKRNPGRPFPHFASLHAGHQAADYMGARGAERKPQRRRFFATIGLPPARTACLRAAAAFLAGGFAGTAAAAAARAERVGFVGAAARARAERVDLAGAGAVGSGAGAAA